MARPQDAAKIHSTVKAAAPNNAARETRVKLPRRMWAIALEIKMG
jgi:tRNA threonylcarbamoyladenosine modification (KEOPS) complex  Pcc1 subunit